jgi:phage-related protein
LEPDNWKLFDDVGAGTKEIRIHDTAGIYRVMYVAKFEEAIYVLHCFQKKTEATTKHDKSIAEARYRAVVRARKKLGRSLGSSLTFDTEPILTCS